MPLFKQEFPDYDGGFYLPDGWMDNSWHNDVCPHAMKRHEDGTDIIEARIWQDYANRENREYEDGKRYQFDIQVNDVRIFCYETDMIDEIKALVSALEI